MSLNSITQSQLNDDRRSRIAANKDGGYRKSDYAKALDGVNPANAPQDRIGSDYEQLRAVASAGERGAAGPQRRAEADQDLENVVGDSLRRSAYQQDDDQRAIAEAGNQLRFNAMSDDERLRFDILGDPKNYGDADPDDFRFRMEVLAMMQNQKQQDEDRQLERAYQAQQVADATSQRDYTTRRQALELQQLELRAQPGYQEPLDPIGQLQYNALLRDDRVADEEYNLINGLARDGSELEQYTRTPWEQAVSEATGLRTPKGSYEAVGDLDLGAAVGAARDKLVGWLPQPLGGPLIGGGSETVEQRGQAIKSHPAWEYAMQIVAEHEAKPGQLNEAALIRELYTLVDSADDVPEGFVESILINRGYAQ